MIDTDICYLQDEVNDEIIKRLRRFMEQYAVEAYDEEQHTGLVRHILTRVGRKTGEVMVCLVINGEELTGRYQSKMSENEEKESAGKNGLAPLKEKLIEKGNS